MKQMEDIIQAIKRAKCVYVIGNGGSASCANHFASDLVKRGGIKAISLVANEALITSYANDISYEDVFYEQLKVFLRRGDLLITISGSGTSKNIVKAKAYAEKKGNRVLNFPTMIEKKCSMDKIEEIHLELAHKIISKLSEK